MVQAFLRDQVPPLFPSWVACRRNVPCPLETGVRWALSSWAACTSCGVWGGSLLQEHAPPASVARIQEPTAWSRTAQASDVTHKQLSLLRVMRGRGLHWLRATVGASFRWVSLLPPSFPSATRVSHGMRWHQIFKEHAAKKEEWCPPGQKPWTLNGSSATHNCKKNKKKIKNFKKPTKITAVEKKIRYFNCRWSKLSV